MHLWDLIFPGIHAICMDWNVKQDAHCVINTYHLGTVIVMNANKFNC